MQILMRFALMLGLWIMVIQAAAQTFYVNNSDGNLLLLDINGCVTDVVVGVGSYTDIATHPNGNIYAIKSNGDLYRLNTNTGASTLITDFQGSGYYALTANANGDIFAATGNGGLSSYNPITNDITDYPNMGFGASGDLTFYEGDMYMAATNNTMVRISPNNPSENTAVIDFSSSNATIFGIVSAVNGCNTQTYAISDDNNSRVFQIDWDNATFNEICTIPHRVYGGASEFEFNASEEQIRIDSIAIEADCGDVAANVTITATSVNGGLSYSLNNQPPQVDGVYPNLPYGEYEILLTDDGGCTLTDTFLVAPANNIVVNDIQVTHAACGQPNGTVEILANSTEPSIMYSLNGEDFFATNYFEDVPPGDYTITITDESGCITLVNTTVENVVSYEYMGYNVEDTSCGEQNGSLTVNITPNGNAINYTLGTWENNTGIFDSIPSGDYLLIIEDDNNCDTTINVTIADSEAISIDDIQTVNPECNTSTGAVTVVASPSEGLIYTLNDQQSNTGGFTNVTAGSYLLEITHEDGCTIPAIPVELEDLCGLYIPNAFTPNDDGYNDIFRLYSPSVVEVRSLKIFNRWGALIYEDGGYLAEDFNRGWDGTVNGKKARTGTYVYMFHLVRNGEEEWVSGDITILE